MKKTVTAALALGLMAAPTFAAESTCETSTDSKNCVQVAQAATTVVYTGSAAGLSSAVIGAIVAAGLGYLLIETGSKTD